MKKLLLIISVATMLVPCCDIAAYKPHFDIPMHRFMPDGHSMAKWTGAIATIGLVSWVGYRYWQKKPQKPQEPDKDATNWNGLAKHLQGKGGNPTSNPGSTGSTGSLGDSSGDIGFSSSAISHCTQSTTSHIAWNFIHKKRAKSMLEEDEKEKEALGNFYGSLLGAPGDLPGNLFFWDARCGDESGMSLDDLNKQSKDVYVFIPCSAPTNKISGYCCPPELGIFCVSEGECKVEGDIAQWYSGFVSGGFSASTKGEDRIGMSLHKGTEHIPPYAAFLVADGHHGKSAAEFAQNGLLRMLHREWEGLAAEGMEMNMKLLMKRAFIKTHQEIESTQHAIYWEKGAWTQRQFPGTTALLIVITSDRIYVAQAGDGEAVLTSRVDTNKVKIKPLAGSDGWGKQGSPPTPSMKLIPLEHQDAYVRVVGKAGEYRVAPFASMNLTGLANSGGFGDFYVCPQVLPITHYTEIAVNGSMELLMLSSDGIKSLSRSAENAYKQPNYGENLSLILQALVQAERSAVDQAKDVRDDIALMGVYVQPCVKFIRELAATLVKNKK